MVPAVSEVMTEGGFIKMLKKMSVTTWDRIADLLAKIRQKAATSNDAETYGWADSATALLGNLAVELSMESRECAPDS
jgi:hypothetical protein